MVIKHTCGTIINADYHFCHGCGEKIEKESEKIKHKCGTIVNADHQFCHGCGEKIEKEKKEFNHTCGALVNADHKFCHGCGEKIEKESKEIQHKCGTKVNAGFTFCHSCGEKIEKVLENMLTLNLKEEKEGNEQSSTEDGAGPTPEGIEDYKNQTLKFGTIGKSTMGKSSFINTIFSKKLTDEDYAKTGVGNTTMEQKKYVHPEFKNFTIWDTPGYGTVRMTKQLFLEKVDLKSFDFIFVFLDTVITEDDVWIAGKLNDFEVPFCFVRCKLDLFIDQIKQEKLDRLVEQKKQSNLRIEREKLNKMDLREEQTKQKKLDLLIEKTKQEGEYDDEIQKLRRDIIIDIARGQIMKTSDVFLISNKQDYFQYGDWVKLLRFIGKSISDEKAEVLFFFLPVISPELLQDKYNSLKKRIWKVSSAAGAVAAIPIPFLDIKLNVGLVDREVQIYRDVLGLNSDFAKHHSAKQNISKEETVMQGTASALKTGIGGATFTAMSLLSQVDVAIPVAGSAISAVSVGLLVRRFLSKTLDETYKEAKEFYQKVTTT